VCTHLCASPQSAAAVPLDQLDRHRLLSPRLLGAHVRCVSPEDITLLARRGVSVAHCPSATLAMAGPPAPVRAFLAAGIPVGLGVDNPSLNPRADLLGEARLAVLLARLREEDTLAISDEQALEMATIGAARSLGLDRQVGSLEAGKRADLVVLDAANTKWWPRHSWPSAIVHSAGPADVRLVLVEGRPVVEKGRLTWADPEIEQALGPKAQAASIALLERATLI
jgi:5-methylthioadenosine/S-adenosylhomocysteine deaminase